MKEEKLQTEVRLAPRPKPWNDPKVRSVIYQVLAIVCVGFAIWYLVANTLHNLSLRNISTGFEFLSREAGFAIGESVIKYEPHDTYFRAISVGLLNTMRVAVVGIIFATILGTLIGIARMSTNWLVAKLASIYVETMRNIPLLLQLFFWYAIISQSMPGPRDAYHPITGVFISNRGIRLPALDGGALNWVIASLFLAIVAIVFLANWAKRRQEKTGKIFLFGRYALLIFVLFPIFAWFISGDRLGLEMPVLKGFNFVGGITITPEFGALLIGLIIYTAAFIAEVVRSGIQSVSQGQWEAAGSIGLRRPLIFRLIVLPQALRVIIPPITSQYLNITKNSSLAVAIGYPDIVSVVNTTLSQTGQAIEGIMMVMAAFLTVSLSISAFMNWYNKRIALVER